MGLNMVASSNFSFASSNDNDSLFKEMFPDSEIGSKFKMASTKTTYSLFKKTGFYHRSKSLSMVEFSIFTTTFFESFPLLTIRCGFLGSLTTKEQSLKKVLEEVA